MRLLSVLLPLLLAGCFGFGHCGYSPSQASWTDDALYDAVDAPVIPAAGVPVDVPGAALGSIAVHSSEDKSGHGDASVRYRDGALVASVEEGSSDGLARAARILLENATRLEDASIADEVEAFIASGTPSQARGHRFEDGETVEVTYVDYEHAVPIDGDLLLESMGFNGTARGLEHGPISASLHPDRKEAQLGHYLLVVDAWGRATMHHAWPQETPEEDILADIARVMQESGLPAPTSISTSGAIC